MLHAIIMAGGSGTRFWPLSRQALPKQFLHLHGERTLLQQAFDRIAGLVGNDQVLIVTNKQHVDRTAEQLSSLPLDNIVGEPAGRDTAACIALAAELVARKDSNGRMVVLAADHLIEPTERFHAAVRAAEAHLDREPDALVTFGIPPAYAATGYGYLRRADQAGQIDGVRVFHLRSFHEKPTQQVAEKFLESGEYFWNSGIFVWTASTILAQLEQHVPKLRQAASRIADAWGTPRQNEVFEAEYGPLEKRSIDYAVMEKAPKVAMVETPFRWDDVGSWLALERTQKRTPEGNFVLGHHLGLASSDCVVVGGPDHLVATIGVSNLIIVHTADVTLVARRDDEQAVKTMQQMLADRGYGQFT
ncbi:mannose-1-phosphate guanylyltransferase [bacterium]|nr:mannose-1-phosphate guanylyltransferase [bacterium]